MKYGPVDESALPAFRRLLDYGFRVTEGPREYDPSEEIPGPARVGDRRGVFVDGEPTCTAVHHWWDARVREQWRPAAGLTAVATPPEHRRKGYVERLLRESLGEYRTRGVTLSLLWPFTYPFYQRFGWATGSNYATVEGPPEAFEFADGARMGTFRRLDADDWVLLESVYETACASYGLTLRRDEPWWRHRVFQGWQRDPYVYAWERDGTIRGYLSYTVSDDGESLQVWDHAATDHEAFVNLLRFCYYHTDQVNRVRLNGPSDAGFFDVLPDPRAVDVTLHPGGMVRLVDVAAALTGPLYPPTVDRSVTLRVTDPLVDWNDGTFVLSVTDGEGVCEAVHVNGATTDTPDDSVVVDVGTLSQLHVGQVTPARARELGRLTGEGVDDLFPPAPTYLREVF